MLWEGEQDVCHLQGGEEAGALCPAGHHVVSDTCVPALEEVGRVAGTENLFLMEASAWFQKERLWGQGMSTGFVSELICILVFVS